MSEIVGDLRGIIERSVGERGGNGPEPPASDLQALADETFLPVAELIEIESLLNDKKQIILEGPPGSGKTFVADKFARYFTGNQLSGDRDQRMETIQFHQSYGYEDFVQGIRPHTNPESRQIEYDVEPGVFLRFCELARQDPEGRPHVMIIDEINRGNVARIFGELLFLLEYRKEKVRLPYSNELFDIPKNIYIIGTMNTADRSLALIDYALRRRFYFYRLIPMRNGDAPVLRQWLDKKGVNSREQLVRLFIRLNQEMEGQLDEHHQVGHSYFMRDDIGANEVRDRIWRRAIIPLLEEYFHPRKSRTELEKQFDIALLLGGPEAPPSTVASELEAMEGP